MLFRSVSSPPGIAPITPASQRPVLRDPIFYSWLRYDMSWLMPAEPQGRQEANEPEASPVSSANHAPADYSPDSKLDEAKPRQTAGSDARSTTNSTASANAALPVSAGAPKLETPLPQPAAKPGRQLRKRSQARRRTRQKVQRRLGQEHSHALSPAGFAPASFAYTTQIKERFVYLSSLLNGDEENYFGRVISSSPVTQTLTVSNPDLTAAGSATLEFALQGVQSSSGAIHQVSVAFNGMTIGSLTFDPLEHPVRTFSIPMTQLQNGRNNVTFTKTSTGEVCIEIGRAHV